MSPYSRTRLRPKPIRSSRIDFRWFEPNAWLGGPGGYSDVVMTLNFSPLHFVAFVSFCSEQKFWTEGNKGNEEIHQKVRLLSGIVFPVVLLKLRIFSGPEMLPWLIQVLPQKNREFSILYVILPNPFRLDECHRVIWAFKRLIKKVWGASWGTKSKANLCRIFWSIIRLNVASKRKSMLSCIPVVVAVAVAFTH